MVKGPRLTWVSAMDPTQGGSWCPFGSPAPSTFGHRDLIIIKTDLNVNAWIKPW